MASSFSIVFEFPTPLRSVRLAAPAWQSREAAERRKKAGKGQRAMIQLAHRLFFSLFPRCYARACRRGLRGGCLFPFGPTPLNVNALNPRVRGRSPLGTRTRRFLGLCSRRSSLSHAIRTKLLTPSPWLHSLFSYFRSVYSTRSWNYSPRTQAFPHLLKNRVTQKASCCGLSGFLSRTSVLCQP